MKTLLLCLSLLPLVSCVYHERSDEGRRTLRERDVRSAPSERRRAPRVRETRPNRPVDRWDSMPYLPPFTMRWDCPNEPQMLGYVTR